MGLRCLMSINEPVESGKIVETDGPLVLGYLMDIDSDLPFFDARPRPEHQAAVVMDGLELYADINGVRKSMSVTLGHSLEILDWYVGYNKSPDLRYPEFSIFMIDVLKGLGLGTPVYVRERGYNGEEFFVRSFDEHGNKVLKKYPKKRYAGTVVIARGDVLERKW